MKNENFLCELDKNINHYKLHTNAMPYYEKELKQKYIFDYINNNFKQDYDFINQTADKMARQIINIEKNLYFGDFMSVFSRQAYAYKITESLLNYLIPNEKIKIVMKDKNEFNVPASYIPNDKQIVFYPLLFSENLESADLNAIDSITHEITHAMQFNTDVNIKTGIPKRLVSLLLNNIQEYEEYTPWKKRIYEIEAIKVADTTLQKYLSLSR